MHRTAGSPPQRRTLRERAAPLQRIADALERARLREPSLIVLEAGAGLGKTLLLSSARRAAAAGGVRALAARSAAHEAPFAYGVVRQLLGPALSAAAQDERETLLAQRAAGALLALGDGPSDAPPFDLSFGILDALYWLTVSLCAGGPVALFVDDAHWADAASLRYLDHLLRRIEGLPLAVVVATRPREPGAPDDLLDALRLHPQAETVSLRPLSEAAVAAIVREEFDELADEEFCRACHRASAGNPLYCVELIRTLQREELRPDREAVERVAAVWPASVARHVLRRVAAIGPDASALASAMAVLGDGGALAHAARMAGLDGTRAQAAARGLREIEILVQESPIQFAHPVVSLALRSDLPTEQRERYLARAVDLLATHGAPPEQVAGYLLQLAPGSGRSVEPLRRAAAVARVRGAPDAAVTYLRRALDEPPPHADRTAVLSELGVAEAMITSQDAMGHIAAARAGAADGAQRLALTLELTMTHMMLGRALDAVATIETELALEESLDEAARQLLEAHLCALSFWVSEDNAQARSLLRSFEQAPPLDPGAARLALGARAAQTDISAQFNTRLALDALAGDALATAPWLGNLLGVATLIACDAFGPAATTLEQMLALVRMSGESRAIGNVLALRASLSYATGDLAACEVDCRTHLGPLRGAMGWGAMGYTVSVLLRSLIRRGALDEAEALLEQGDPEPWPQITNLQFFLRAARGELHFAQGRFAEALEDFAAARDRLGRFCRYGGARFAVYGEAEPLALERLGRRDEADALVAEGLPRARAFGGPRNLGATLRVAGLLAGGGPGAALALEAADALEGSGARLELAQARVDAGMLMRHSGRRVEARVHLAAGLDLARQCGATPLADRARAELLATGARPRRDRVTSRDALTPSELRLAQLAAQGMTNREIAQELYLSQKTVEMHLGRAYRKLGIAGRAELGGALGR